MDGIGINKYAQFMFRLRGMGLYTNKIMSQHLPGRGDGDHEQFLIACLVTKYGASNPAFWINIKVFFVI
ncbi:hypothetical protein DPMN_032957 [Dreissena polymorpha]|uniref:Uncharacterized protein n=1 Tax=Dreissena polymorpha TaxID=45954 RepID=A0A9D4M7M0_DREPO|nr:hypothetical protein DPMN_032957 [Dreissena polymorpha]